MNAELRTFLACDLPVNVVDSIVRAQSLFVPEFPRFRWVKRANLHLTMHFLGNVSKEIILHVTEKLNPLFNTNLVIQVRLQEAGAFPRWTSPKVLWISLQGDLSQLQSLQKRTGDVLRDEGIFIDDRAFQPHITVARIPADYSPDLTSIMKIRDYFNDAKSTANSLFRDSFLLPSITLYTSLLTPQGPVYTPYASWKLTSHGI